MQFFHMNDQTLRKERQNSNTVCLFHSEGNETLQTADIRI